MEIPNYSIDEQKQTVAGQMQGLLNSDSPYMKQAETAGKQYANSRGLLNSSMGAQASQGAAIQAALPIAQQDANTHNAFAGQQYGAQLQSALSQQNFTFDQSLQNNAFQNSMAMENLKQNSGLYAHYLTGMAEINKSDMTQAEKNAAQKSMWDALNAGTTMATSLARITFDENGNLVYAKAHDPLPQPDYGESDSSNTGGSTTGGSASGSTSGQGSSGGSGSGGILPDHPMFQK